MHFVVVHNAKKREKNASMTVMELKPELALETRSESGQSWPLSSLA